MAGTARSWRTTALAQNAGDLWGSLAIPAAAARITLTAPASGIGKTPDATENTTAFHYGATKAGSKLMVKGSFDKYNVDEFRAPIVTNVGSLEMGIATELVAITDLDVMTNLLPGIGTYATASGYKEIRVGQKAIAYQCVAVIFPLIEDTTKNGVFMLYSSLNDSGVEWTQSRKELGFTPANFVGYEITTRVATDTLGIYWKEIA
jgi:hypothetical protein